MALDLSQCAIIVLGGGSSKRFGQENKLLSDYRGQPLITHALETVSRVGAGKIVLVTGLDPERVSKLGAEHSIPSVHNPAHQNGMGKSISVGMEALGDHDGPVFVVPGDMPDIPVSIFEKLAAELDEDDKIIRPVYQGKPGHPVLFGADYLSDLKALDGDQGARSVLGRHKTHLIEVHTHEPGVLFDIDVPQR